MPITLIKALIGPEKREPGLPSFFEEFEANRHRLNTLIEAYNDPETPDPQAALDAISNYIRIIDNQYPDHIVSNYPDYHQQMHVTLFHELQRERQRWGAASLNEEANLSELLTHMSPEKADAFAALLSKRETEGLLSLYDAEDSLEAEAFRRFFTTHEITFVGGNNNRLFKITAEDGSKQLLKLENRSQMPKDAETELQQHHVLDDTLLPIHAERQVTFNQEETMVTRTLLVTDFCDGHNLEYEPSDDAHRAKSALHFFSQMANILQVMAEHHFIFTDMKNSNWLVDNKGRLRIADTKSFMFVDDKDNWDLRYEKNRWYGFLRSPGMMAPESTKNTERPIDKIHAFWLGKNLYQYLSQCDVTTLAGKNDADYAPTNRDYNKKKYDFSAPVFTTPPVGPELVSLIQGLIKPNPVDRLSVKEAMDTLQRIHHEHYGVTVSEGLSHSEIYREKMASLSGRAPSTDESDESYSPP